MEKNMGSSNNFICNKCDFSFSTSGPWEFYRDKKGNSKPYGHPVPISAEAEKAGITGLTADVFCLTCMENINNFILVEYKKPVKDQNNDVGRGRRAKRRIPPKAGLYEM